MLKPTLVSSDMVRRKTVSNTIVRQSARLQRLLVPHSAHKQMSGGE